MITLILIEPVDEGYGALIVEAFGRLLIDGGGQSDGWGDGGRGIENLVTTNKMGDSVVGRTIYKSIKDKVCGSQKGSCG